MKILTITIILCLTATTKTHNYKIYKHFNHYDLACNGNLYVDFVNYAKAKKVARMICK